MIAKIIAMLWENPALPGIPRVKHVLDLLLKPCQKKQKKLEQRRGFSAWYWDCPRKNQPDQRQSVLRINDFSNYKNIVAGTVPIGIRALHYLGLRVWSAFVSIQCYFVPDISVRSIINIKGLTCSHNSCFSLSISDLRAFSSRRTITTLSIARLRSTCSRWY